MPIIYTELRQVYYQTGSGSDQGNPIPEPHLFQTVANFLTQCSVAMDLRCGEIFNDHFITRLPMSPTVKEF